MLMIKKIAQHPFFVVLLLIITSSFFRISNLNLIEFKADEAANILLAAQPILGHPLSPGGTVSSLGILNPPVFNYFLLPILFFSFDPRVITFFIALSNIIAIIGLFLIIKKYYSTQTAFISSVLISLSPWAILYSRKIWMQDLLLPFIALMLLSIHKLIIDKKEHYWLLYGLSSALLIQLHQISIIFVLIISIFLILKRVKINLKFLILGTAIGLLPLMPYIIYEFSNNFPDLKSILDTKSKLSPNYSWQIFIRPLQIMNIGDFRFILGDDTLTFAQKFPLIYKARQILYIEYLLLPLGIFIFIKKNKQLSFLAYSAILTVIAYFILKIEPFMHYFIIIMPLLFIFTSTAISELISSKRFSIKALGTIIFVLIILSSLSFNKAFFDLISTQGGLKGDYGATLEKQGKEILTKLNDKNPDIKEKALSNYLSLNYMYGYSPLGKILYGNVAAKDIPGLEKKLKQDPSDKRIQFAILSFNTRQPATPESINMLEQKSKLIEGYFPLYENVKQNYMSEHLKKEYVSGNRKFFYPEHWILKNEDGLITLFGDEYEVFIENFENDKISFECKNGKQKCDDNTILEIKNSVTSIY